MKKFDDLKEKINNSLTNMEIVVDDIKFEKKGKYSFLTIVLDKVGGIDLDAIVDATHIINPIVDDYDVSDEAYILDVISKERGDING